MQNGQTIVEILNEISYLDWEFRVDEMGNGYFIQVLFNAPDIHTGTIEQQRGRKWYVSPYSSDSEIVQTVFLAIMVAEEHERRENFRFNNEMIFGPHYSSLALAEFASRGDEVEDARQHLVL